MQKKALILLDLTRGSAITNGTVLALVGCVGCVP